MSVNPNEPVVPPAQSAPGQPGTQTPAENALFKKAGGDWNKAAESYFNAVNKIGELHGTVQTQEQQLQQLQQVVQGLVGGGQPGADNPLTRLNTEFGLPIEPFEQAIDDRVGKKVEKALTELLGPVVRAAQAEDELSAEIDGFPDLKSKAQKFMRGNPETQKVFNAVRGSDPVAAWKYAIQQTLIAENQSPTPPPPAATLPGGMTPAGRSAPSGSGPDQRTREKEALDYGKAYGDMRPYGHERLTGTSVERAVRDIMTQLGYPPTEGTRW